MKNIAVFCSGNGTNLQAIINAVKRKQLRANIALVVSDNHGAFALRRAKKAKIKTIVVERKLFNSRDDFEKEIVSCLKKEKINLLVLAGFMRVLGSVLIGAYKNKIINIHPALLPSFKGAHGIKDAFEYGVKTTGVTIHFVDELMDNGPIILQEAVSIKENDTLDSLEQRIHRVEHKLYYKAIALYVSNRLKVVGRKVKIV